MLDTPTTKTQGYSIVEMRELRNKNDCFRIYYDENSELVIEFYNGAKLDALFQAKIPSKMLQAVFGIDSIGDIYERIIYTINNKDYFIKDIDGQKKLYLKNDNIALRKVIDNRYFAGIFKKILNEKDKEIVDLNNLIGNLKKKLNQYSSYINSGKSNINKNNMSIKRFNTMYNTAIDLNEPFIDLGFKNKGNELLMNLSGFNFNRLEKLSLSINRISSISPLKNMNLDKLQTLNLYKNKVQDLSPLKVANLVELKIINLQKNIISDIRPLMELNCFDLQILLLDNNQIEDITPLVEVKFNGLQKLTLDHNNIKDVSGFEHVPFKQLKILSLHHNNIKDIRVFEKIILNLNSLESLWLYQNDFKNNNNDYIISILRKEIKDFL